MSALHLPDDLVDFLQAGRKLDYKASLCEAGLVTLYPLDRLQLRTFGMHCSSTPLTADDPHKGWSGCYEVPGVDLVAECKRYAPAGLLVWFPNEQRYGVWDSSHDIIQVFSAETNWTEIIKAPWRYINAQWSFCQEKGKAKPVDYLIPWQYPFRGHPSP